MDGLATLFAAQHAVANTDVGKGTAHHHLVITTARPVRIEVIRLHTLGLQVFTRWRAGLDVAGRRDVVSGDGVTKYRQHPRLLNRLQRRQRLVDGFKIRRMLHVGGVIAPGVGLALAHGDRAPVLIAGEHVGIAAAEHVVLNQRDRIGNILVARPDVLEKHRTVIGVQPQRLLAQVDTRIAGQRVGHHQRRRRQPVGLDLRMHAAFKVTVTREHRRYGKVVLADHLRYFIGQRPGVADTGGAAVTHQVEAQLVQAVGQASLFQIIGYHLGTRCQRGFNPGLAHQPALNGVFSQQAGRHHHTGVGGIGTGSNGSDNHSTVIQHVLFAVHHNGCLRVRAAHCGAATALAFKTSLLAVGGRHLQCQQLFKGRRHIRQRNAVLRATRPCQAGLHLAHIQVQGIGKFRFITGLTPQALRFAVSLNAGNNLIRAATQAHVAQGFIIHREEAAGRAIFRCHVGDGGTVSQRQISQAITIKLHKLADHALGTQHLRHGQHQVGGGNALTQPASQLEANHLGDQHRHRLPQHGGLRLNAADTPAQHAQAVNHGGVRVGAHERIGPGPLLAVNLGRPHGLRQILKVDLVTDAGARRYHTEVVEGFLPPAQKLVTLAVALHLDLDVLRKGLVAGKAVHHHRVVNHQINRRQRVDLLRVTVGAGHRITHGGQIDHCRHPGKVLHQYTGRAILNLAIRAPLLQPVRHRLDVVQGYGFAVFVAQQVFQQHLERLGQALNRRYLLGCLG